jgi:predicted nucleotidyltransferase
MGLKLFLEEFFGISVDLVTIESLKPYLRERVLLEAKNVA